MLTEEGKVRLNDPVSRFIPELKGLKVAVMQPAAAGAGPQQRPPVTPRNLASPRCRRPDITVRDLLTHTRVSSAARSSGARRQGRR